MSKIHDINTVARHLVAQAVRQAEIVWDGDLSEGTQYLIRQEAERLADNFQPPYADYVRAYQNLTALAGPED